MNSQQMKCVTIIDEIGLNIVEDLWHVSQFGRLKQVRDFIENQEIDINIQSASKNTPLHSACYSDNKDIAKYLVENGADLNIQDDGGDTPLHNATDIHSSSNGNLDLSLVKYLVENGADVNIRNADNETALDIALFYQRNGYPTDDLVSYLTDRI